MIEEQMQMMKNYALKEHRPVVGQCLSKTDSFRPGHCGQGHAVAGHCQSAQQRS